MHLFHPLTTAIVLGTFLLVPVLVFCTYYFSRRGMRTSLCLAAGASVWALVMLWICMYGQTLLSPLQVLPVLVVNLAWPPVGIYIYREFFVGEGLNMQWLTGIQLFRNIGALFILENTRGTVGTMFAYVAGIGDVIVGMTAAGILLWTLLGKKVSKGWYYFLICIGVADFISAYTFGTLSSSVPFQLFAFGEQHDVLQFPLGLIPFILVPLAMSYHMLMYLTLRRVRST
jgi:hypothetical protein